MCGITPQMAVLDRAHSIGNLSLGFGIGTICQDIVVCPKRSSGRTQQLQERGYLKCISLLETSDASI